MRIAFLQHTWDDNLGIMQLSACLKANGHECDLFLEERGWLEHVVDYGPDMIGLSCTTGQHVTALAAARELDALAGRHFPVIMGGPHPTFYPEVLSENPNLDAICVGEGDQAIVDFAEAWPNLDAVSKIPNIHVRLGDTIVQNAVRPLVEDLDTLPFPDRSYYRKYPFLAKNVTKYMLSGRGCPYDCSFCFNHQMMEVYRGLGHYVRKRSVPSVIEEIVELRDTWGLKRIGFSCDVFIVDRPWFLEFARVYAKQVGIPYICNIRVNLVNDEIARALADSGCECVSFGVESGSDDLRNSVLGKRVSREQILECARLCKKYGLRMLTHNIVGLPTESVEQAFETVRLNREIDPDFPWCSVLQFYPGTRVAEIAIEANLLPPEYSHEAYSFYEGSALDQGNARELLNLQRLFFYAVKVPALEPLIRRLIRLPPNPIYRYLFVASYGYILNGRSAIGATRLVQLYFKTNNKLSRDARLPPREAGSAVSGAGTHHNR